MNAGADDICTPLECAMIVQQLVLIVLMISNLPLEKFLHTLDYLKVVEAGHTKGLYEQATECARILAQEASNFSELSNRIIKAKTEWTGGGVYQ